MRARGVARGQARRGSTRAGHLARLQGTNGLLMNGARLVAEPQDALDVLYGVGVYEASDQSLERADSNRGLRRCSSVVSDGQGHTGQAGRRRHDARTACPGTCRAGVEGAALARRRRSLCAQRVGSQVSAHRLPGASGVAGHLTGPIGSAATDTPREQGQHSHTSKTLARKHLRSRHRSSRAARDRLSAARSGRSCESPCRGLSGSRRAAGRGRHSR